jgi:anaerobic selenocysteine-containing dehydrogenase
MLAQAGTSRRDFLCLGAAAVTAACGGCAILGSRKADVAVEPKQGAIRLTEAQSTALLASEGSILH